MSEFYCQRCGQPIDFGPYCSELCYNRAQNEENEENGSYDGEPQTEENNDA